MGPPLARLALALLVALAWSPSLGWAQANPVPAEPVEFDTADSVTLKGFFYPSSKGKKAATVLLLPKIGTPSQQGGWDALAKGLQEKGFAVLRFDYRGHGSSKSVTKDFWQFPDRDHPYIPNRQLVTGFNATRPDQSKLKIEHQDYVKNARDYYPHLVNDVAAAKLYLDRKNDKDQCNSGNLILVGAEDGATLGLLWMMSECYRYRGSEGRRPLDPPDLDKKPEGDHATALVCLSLSTSLGGRPLPVTEWLQHMAREHDTQAAFVYGDEKNAPAQAANWVKVMKGGRKDVDYTGDKKIDKAGKLIGQALLNNELKTQEWIIDDYLVKLLEHRGWKEGSTRAGASWWQYQKNLLPLLAKKEKGETLNPVPLGNLGLIR